MRLPLVGETYQARSLTAAAQECINLIPERIEDLNETEKGGWALYGAPGRQLFTNLLDIDAAAHPVRGLWSGGGRLFVAAGTKEFELNSSGALVGLVHTIADDAFHSPVTFWSNGNQLLIISAGVVYCDNGAGPVPITLAGLSGFATVNPFAHNQLLWDSGDTFDIGMVGQTITYNGNPYTVLSVTNGQLLTINSSISVVSNKAWSATPILSASSATFLDDYFVISRPQSRQMNSSAILDGTTWDLLDFATKESWADNIRSILANDEQLYVFGTESSEVWQINPQNTAFPFSRIDGAAARFGSISAWGPVSMGGKVYFIGGDGSGQLTAYRLDGFTPVRISTHAEEARWNALGIGPDCVSYSYLEEGHEFWVIDFGAEAYAWDATEKTWTKRAQYISSAFGPYHTKFHTFVQNEAGLPSNNWGSGKHITAGTDRDITWGRIYESSMNLYSDAGNDIAWRRAIPYRFNGGNRIFFGRQTLEMETGTVASGAAPNITRDYSDDRGQTFVNPQTASIGIHNDYSLRVFWPQGGSSRGRVWRYGGIGQYKVAIVELDAEEVLGTA